MLDWSLSVSADGESTYFLDQIQERVGRHVFKLGSAGLNNSRAHIFWTKFRKELDGMLLIWGLQD